MGNMRMCGVLGRRGKLLLQQEAAFKSLVLTHRLQARVINTCPGRV